MSNGTGPFSTGLGLEDKERGNRSFYVRSFYVIEGTALLMEPRNSRYPFNVNIGAVWMVSSRPSRRYCVKCRSINNLENVR